MVKPHPDCDGLANDLGHHYYGAQDCTCDAVRAREMRAFGILPSWVGDGDRYLTEMGFPPDGDCEDGDSTLWSAVAGMPLPALRGWVYWNLPAAYNEVRTREGYVSVDHLQGIVAALHERAVVSEGAAAILMGEDYAVRVCKNATLQLARMTERLSEEMGPGGRMLADYQPTNILRETIQFAAFLGSTRPEQREALLDSLEQTARRIDEDPDGEKEREDD